MDFNIHDEAGTWIGMIESPTSAIWTERYNTPGEFEIYTPATQELFELLLPGRYEGTARAAAPIETVHFITRPDRNTVMLVERIELTTDDEEDDFIRIKGRAASCLLDRRIVWKQTSLSGRVDMAIYRLVRENAINPEDEARRLPLLMDAPNVLADTISAQYTGAGLLEAVKDITAAYGLGFRVVTDGRSIITLRLELYKGADKSLAQTANSPVIFSPDFENLSASAYAFDMEKYKNVALVAGEGEGTARKQAAQGQAAGMARREMYVDARDMSTNDGEISEEDYTAQLKARGEEKLAERDVAEAFGGEVDTGNTFVIGVDYDVGDIVTVVNEYGVRADARVSDVSECWDESGYSTDCVFEGLEG